MLQQIQTLQIIAGKHKDFEVGRIVPSLFMDVKSIEINQIYIFWLSGSEYGKSYDSFEIQMKI